MGTESLKQRIEELKHQKTEIEKQLSELMGLLFKQEDETRRNKKLTPAMTEVLKAMAAGAVLVKSEWRKEGSWLQGSGELLKVTTVTFEGLRARRIIREGEMKSALVYYYPLTDWGREVAAKLVAR